MMHSRFTDAFPAGKGGLEPSLRRALDNLENIPDTFCGLLWLHDPDFIYMSPNVEKVLGHPQTNFYQNGVFFFQSITPHRLVMRIFDELNEFIGKLSDHPMFTRAPLTSVLQAALIDHANNEIPILHTSAFIDFRRTRFDCYLILGSWLDLRGKDQTEIKQISRRTSELLHEIKNHYQTRAPDHFTKPIPIKLTQRQFELLSLMADGQSTKDISQQLGISVNTVETHRRKLLEKFEARNVAELVSKASRSDLLRDSATNSDAF